MPSRLCAKADVDVYLSKRRGSILCVSCTSKDCDCERLICFQHGKLGQIALGTPRKVINSLPAGTQVRLLLQAMKQRQCIGLSCYAMFTCGRDELVCTL